MFGDKGYCVGAAQRTPKKNACHHATIKQNNMKGKNRGQDRWLSEMHSPYERVFAHRRRRVRYWGLGKVQIQAGIRELVFNLKCVMSLGVQRIDLLLIRWQDI